MYLLIVYCKNLEVLRLALTLDELKIFTRTVTKSGASFELIKNKRSMYFDDIEELRLFIREEI